MILNDILNFYNLIKNINIKDISNSEDKYKLLKIFRTLKHYNEEFEKFKKDAKDKIIVDKEKFSKKLEESKENKEAKEYVDNINSELTSLFIKEIMSDKKDISFDKISKDSFIQISNTNDLTLEQLDCIEQNIVET